ncbi:MAG: hypothetical protein ACOCW8_01565 [bacterium]
MKLISIFLVVLFLSSCNSTLRNEKEKPVARVGEKYLYENDLKGIFSPSLSSPDSISIRKAYIDKWIRKQLLLQKAELNLPEEQKDVSRYMDDYRTSLLIYKYEQMLLKQELDTNVTKGEIKAYYEENTTNFILEENIIRGLFLEIPRSAPNQDKLKKWYKSEKEEDLKNLENYRFQYATSFNYFMETWSPLEPWLLKMGENISNPQNYFRYRKTVESSDSANNYYLYVKEFIPAKSIAPVEYVKNEISSIILNKRKYRLIKQLENDVYNTALGRKKFHIY